METRNCPKCGEEIIYSTKYSKIRAEIRNTNCLSCNNNGKNNPMYGISRKFSKKVKNKISLSLTGIKRSEKTKKKISISQQGQKNSMYGKSVYDMWVEKYGKKEADKRQEQKAYKCSTFNLGLKRSDETRKKQRLSAIKRIENRFGQSSPNYNPNGCKIIDEYGKKNGFNFRHAENGGEVCIDGYYPDGVDEMRKTIIEIDEKHHFDINGNLKQKDVQRQNYLENLGYKVIRIKYESNF
jgi:hypothetical protein